jgi:aldose 1-epimerase
LAGPLGEPLDLLGSWDGADLAIVVDAVRSGAPPGTLTLDWLGVPGGLDPQPGDSRSPSTHGLGVADVYRLARAIGQAPPLVAVVGIEGQDFSHGEGLSAAVQVGISEAVNVVMALAEGPLEHAARRNGYPGPYESGYMMRAGELIEIRCGDREALIDQQGATLVQVAAAGADLLATPSQVPSRGCYGQLLVPWPGRIPDGSYHFDGTSHQLPVDDLDMHSAIHGLVRWAPWNVTERAAGSVTLSHHLLALPGYPFSLAIEQSYAWQDSRLESCTTATNIGTRTAPFGFGAHPYFTVGPSGIDDAVLHLPAREYFLCDARLDPKLPAVPVDGSPYDFRKPRPVGTIELDTTYTGLQRDDEGNVAVNLRSADGALTITCTYSDPIEFVQLYSGDTLENGRRVALAIEPYTCLPNAFNNGVGLMRLPVSGSVSVRWALSAG